MNINLTDRLLSQRATKAAGQKATVISRDLDITHLERLLLDDAGRLRPVLAHELRAFAQEQLHLFGHRYGVYQFPTVELVEYLREKIGGRSAIEIGAGNGAIARALGIVATDSYSQESGAVRAYYDQLGQAPAHLCGPDVVRLDAAQALATYAPQVALGCWVTQREPRAMPQGKGQGYIDGVNEVALLLGQGRPVAEEYLFVGNERNHGLKQVLRHPKLKFTVLENPPWLVSRSQSPHHNLIWRITRR